MQRPDATTPGPGGLDRRGAGLGARRIAAGAVLGAFVALLAVVLPGGVDVGAVFTGASEPAKTAGAQPLRAPVHTCLTWQRQDAADARQVDCAQPHLFEVTGTVDLTDFGSGESFPDAARWHELVTNRCTERTSQALAGRFDPFGRFTVGAIKPSEDSWRRGDRTLRCGVQATGRSGGLYPTTGRVMTQDQSDVHQPGTCLGNDGKVVGDPVDCARPHAVEVVGVVDLVNAFPGGYPDEPAQDRVLDGECARLAADHAGGPDVVGEKKLTVFWETLRRESWEAGSTRVDCRLGAFLPDRSGFAPVTGSVQGPVQIGTEPAPPAPKATGPSRITVPPVVDAATPGPPPPPS